MTMISPGDEIEQENNIYGKEQRSNISGDHYPMCSYFSKVRSDDEEQSSDDYERGKGKYKDLLDFVQKEIGPLIENEFAEVCGRIRGKAKPKVRSGIGSEFKNILIPSNCSY